MEKRDFYLYINGQPVPVSEEVYREYYRARIRSVILWAG